jgi:hypothetical protein
MARTNERIAMDTLTGTWHRLYGYIPKTMVWKKALEEGVLQRHTGFLLVCDEALEVDQLEEAAPCDKQLFTLIIKQ